MMVVFIKSVRNYRKYELNSDILTLILFNMDISVNIHNYERKMYVCDPNILLDESLSPNFDVLVFI